MGIHTGNKGEWSEPYVWMWLLGHGKIHAADAYMQPIEDMYYVINRVILRTKEQDFSLLIDNDNILVEDTGKEIPRSEFISNADFLLDTINSTVKGTFSVDPVEEFMTDIGYDKIKTDSTDKNDIYLEIHDPVTCSDHVLGFSIKSTFGHKSTLLNASKKTNFVFRLKGDVTPDLIDAVNSHSGNLIDRFKLITDRGVDLVYDYASSDVYCSNLRMLDSNMDRLVAEMLRLHYVEGVSDIKDQIAHLAKSNPLGAIGDDREKYYKYKIRKLLSAHALGMVPGTSWTGTEDATGGIIFAAEEPLCYHLYNRDEFEEFLVSNTKLDTPSTSRHEFAKIDRDLEGYILKLNLQVRFK